jgi:hypothetical protein
MTRSSKLLGLGAVLALASGAAQAENLDAGKSAAALFTANCATCHSSPRGLAKDRGSGGLASFLQEHYTSGPQSAAALAGYLIANPGNPRAKQGPVVRNPAAPEEAKQGEAKSERQTRTPHISTVRPDSMIEPTDQKRSNTESAKGHGKRQQTKQEAPAAPAASAAEPTAAATPAPAAPAAAPAAAPVAAAPPPPDQPAFSAPSP